jgi:nicotinamide mononucleotide transporter
VNAVLEWSAVVLGLLYLLGAVAQHRSCWIAGGLSALLFLQLFREAGLPMQALLQVYYVIVAVHGWWHWGSANSGTELPVRRWPAGYHIAALAVLGLSTLAVALLRQGPEPFTVVLDAATSLGSLLATWMVARKVLENWLYWIAIDSAAAILYLHSGLTATAGLYVLYTVIACFGWIRWRQTYRPQS